MRILVACEESQEVTKAFRARGHEAYSLDVVPCSGGRPDWHIQDDVYRALKPWYEWDMVIAFPPCTHLCVSGARHFRAKQADGRQKSAVEFFMFFTTLENVPKVCIENPVGIMSTIYRKPDQIIQPYQFGEDASKKTCLWLKGLPLLQPTEYVAPRVLGGRPRWSNQTISGQNKLGPSTQRSMLRSKTYPAIARAMAEQWG